MLTNTRERYGLIAQVFHWLTAGFILTLIPLGLFMVQLPISSTEETGYKFWFYSLHKTLGVTVFAVASLRVVWAVTQPHPAPLNGERKLESLGAQTVHWALYGSIILMPLTGLLHHSVAEGFAPIWWPFSQNLPFVPKSAQLASLFGAAHTFTAILLGLSVALHIGGAMKHAIIDRDSTLARMIPGMKPAISADLPKPHYQRLSGLLAGMLFVILGIIISLDYVITRSNTGQNKLIATIATNSTNSWIVDYKQSTLVIEIIQSGVPVAGSFGNWDAAINFDPENLEASNVKVEIDISSLALGGVSQHAMSEDFLDAVLHPISTFSADKFIKTGNDSFEAQGQLTLAGQTRPITLPFMLKIENNRAFVEGQVAIQRLNFDVGKKGYSNDGVLGFEVLIKVTVEAEKAAN